MGQEWKSIPLSLFTEQHSPDTHNAWPSFFWPNWLGGTWIFRKWHHELTFSTALSSKNYVEKGFWSYLLTVAGMGLVQWWQLPQLSLKIVPTLLSTCETQSLRAKYGPPSHFMWPTGASKVHDRLKPISSIHTRSICIAFTEQTTSYPLTPNVFLSALAQTVILAAA